MLDKNIEKVIDNTNSYYEKIWYIPIRNNISVENYMNTVIKQVTFNGIKLTDSCWGFKSGPKNKETFDSLNIGDYIFFIGRDSEGYEFIDSIATLKDKYSSEQESLNNWNDSQYELIIKFDSVFILKNKLRLTKNRKKLNNILKNVPNDIFHNGYEMFRQFVLNERISRTRLGAKLIDENTFVYRIKSACDGTYIYNNNLPEDDELKSNNEPKNINDEIDKFIIEFNESLFKNFSDIKIQTRCPNQKDKRTSLNNKPTSNQKERNNLSAKNQKIIGLTGEKFIYTLLLNKNRKLLESLGIKNENDIINIEWSNLGYDGDISNFNDLSLGHDIEIILKDKTLKLEIKTSFSNSGYYSITRNELKEMVNYKDDYFVVKINYLNRLENGEAPDIIIENFPIFNVLENLNRIKTMDIYI